MDDDLIPLLNKAYFFLKFRPRSEKEIRDYLYKKVRTTHWSHEAADKIIKKLKKQKLVDDEKFIEWFIRSRINLRPKSVKLLRFELIQKGVDQELIEKHFLKNNVDEEKLAFKVLSKRWPRFKLLSPKKRLEKAYRFLLSRGFNYDICKKTIADLNIKE